MKQKLLVLNKEYDFSFGFPVLLFNYIKLLNIQVSKRVKIFENL